MGGAIDTEKPQRRNGGQEKEMNCFGRIKRLQSSVLAARQIGVTRTARVCGGLGGTVHLRRQGDCAIDQQSQGEI